MIDPRVACGIWEVGSDRIGHFRALFGVLLVLVFTKYAFLSEFPTTTRRQVVFEIMKVLDVFCACFAL